MTTLSPSEREKRLSEIEAALIPSKAAFEESRTYFRQSVPQDLKGPLAPIMKLLDAFETSTKLLAEVCTLARQPLPFRLPTEKRPLKNGDHFTGYEKIMVVQRADDGTLLLLHGQLDGNGDAYLEDIGDYEIESNAEAFLYESDLLALFQQFLNQESK